jgi:hypothetical protein
MNQDSFVPMFAQQLEMWWRVALRTLIGPKQPAQAPSGFAGFFAEQLALAIQPPSCTTTDPTGRQPKKELPMNHITLTPTIATIRFLHDELAVCAQDIRVLSGLVLESLSVMAGRFTPADQDLFELRTADLGELSDRHVELSYLIRTLEAGQVIEPTIVLPVQSFWTDEPF